MKKAIISVSGGVADIEQNDNDLNIVIVDHDNEDVYNITGNEDAIVEVSGGVAEVTTCKDNIDVTINDYDNLKGGI